MTTLTKADIPASLQSLNWLEASEDNCMTYHGNRVIIAIPYEDQYEAHSFDYAPKFAIARHDFDNCHFEMEYSTVIWKLSEVDYFYPII